MSDQVTSIPVSAPRPARFQGVRRRAATNYGRELLAWGLLPVMMGAVEGGVTGVIVKNAFVGVVSDVQLNYSVAVLTGAPAFANIASFVWTGLSHGRNKIRFLVVLQVLVALLVGMVVFASRSPGGLLVLLVAAVGARVCWSGVLILRSTVWRANYPRSIRATLAGRLSGLQAITMTLTILVIGAGVRAHIDAYRVLFPLAGLFGIAGAWLYSRVRMRRQQALLESERSGEHTSRSLVHPAAMFTVLREDVKFRRYMICMFIFGSGNLMLMAPTVIMFKDRFALNPFVSMVLASVIPVAMIPITVPFWGRLLDRMHIIRFRAIHAWMFVTSIGLYLTAAATDQTWLLFCGAMFQGIAYGGGVLGWNLGHHDFAPVEKASLYMAVHVSSTGLRGLFAPVIAVSIYQYLEIQSAGTGHWCLAVSLALSIIGAFGFILLRRTLTGTGHDSTFEDPPRQISA